MTFYNSYSRTQSLGVLRSPQTIHDSVGQNNRVDIFSFKLTGRSSFKSLLNELHSNVNLSLFNSKGKRIGVSKNSGQQSEEINTVLEQGHYFIKTTLRGGGTSYRLELTASPVSQPDPRTAKFVGLTTDNKLAFFNSDNLANVKKIRVSGLQSGERLLGIDFRPVSGELFGLGSTSRLYRIDVSTGSATAVNSQPFAVKLNGKNFGFDFNPSVDRVRIVSDAGQNLRLVPDTGVVVDGNPMLDGIQADGNLNGASNSIAATAYTNSFPNVGPMTPPAATTQYGINTKTDELFIQNPPNSGTLTRVGALGVNFSGNTAFDIVSQPANGNTPATNSAFAVSGSSLYSINLDNGSATLLGKVRYNYTSLRFRGLAARS